MKSRQDLQLDRRIGLLLRYVIRESRLDAKRVAKVLGVSYLTLKKILAGRRPLRCSEWIKFCELAGLSAGSLLCHAAVWDPDVTVGQARKITWN